MSTFIEPPPSNVKLFFLIGASEMKYLHLDPRDPAQQHLLDISQFTEHGRCWVCVHAWTKKPRDKQRGRDMICPSAALLVHPPRWCVSGALHSTEHSITGNGLCEFLCLTLSMRNECVCVCVARLPTWKPISTPSALTPAPVHVCLQRVSACPPALHSFTKSSRSCHLCSE